MPDSDSGAVAWPAQARHDREATALRSPGWLRLTRAAAVVITLAVGAASFRLSFEALRDLAVRAHVPADLAWLWPVIVDGTIVLSTLGVVALAGYRGLRRDRAFFWMVLTFAAGVSIGSNTLHAIVPPGQPLSPWLTGFMASIAPVSLLATTHGLTVLTRVNRAAGAVAPMGVNAVPVDNDAGVDTPGEDEQDPVAPHERDRWQQIAAAVLARANLKDTSQAEIAEVLALTYDKEWTQRGIGRRLQMSHHTVAKIQAAGADLLRSGTVNIDAAVS